MHREMKKKASELGTLRMIQVKFAESGVDEQAGIRLMNPEEQ